MNLQLKYGKGMLSSELRNLRSPIELKTRHIATLLKPEEIILQALQKPIGSFPFTQLFKNTGNVLIIAPDDLHETGGEHYLPILVQMLNELCIPNSEITILVAAAWGARRNGVHRLLSVEKSSPAPKILYHDPCDVKSLEYVGHTRRGTPVFVNRMLIDADSIILCGSVSHDPFAGYNGGPRLVVPHCAGEETIERCLALTIDPAENRIHPRCSDGIIEGNPLQEDAREAFRCITVDFLLHTILNHCNTVIGAVAGTPLQAHAAGCHMIDDIYRVPIDYQAELVIASSGGYPYDRNFIEAHTALHHAVQAARPGGTIIFLAECREGLGVRDFLRWFGKDSAGHPHSELTKRHHLEGVAAISTMQKARDQRIIAVTNLPPEVVTTLGFTPAGSLLEAMQLAQKSATEANGVYIMPNAATTVPYLA